MLSQSFIIASVAPGVISSDSAQQAILHTLSENACFGIQELAQFCLLAALNVVLWY